MRYALNCRITLAKRTTDSAVCETGASPAEQAVDRDPARDIRKDVWCGRRKPHPALPEKKEECSWQLQLSAGPESR